MTNLYELKNPSKEAMKANLKGLYGARDWI